MSKILITDDNDPFRKVLADILTEEGYDVYEAAQGVEALEILTETDIDLILLDLIMPEMEGIETLGHISTKFTGIPVIMMSGDSQRIDTEFYLKLAGRFGAKAILQKPFHMQEVSNLIETYLS
ncbi:MAG: response regulator [Chloroflexota bacterium]